MATARCSSVRRVRPVSTETAYTKRTYHYQERNFRLTYVHGKIVNGILA